jgi:hypothetical protein
LQYNGLAVNLPPIIRMQIKTPTPNFKQMVIILSDNHHLQQFCLILKFQTTIIIEKSQPEFYSEKPRHTRGQVEPLVIQQKIIF